MEIFFSKILGNAFQVVNFKFSELELKVNSNNIYPIFFFLKKHTYCQYDCLVDIVGYDTPGKRLRFGIIYNLLSVRYNTRIKVVTKVSSVSALISITSLFFGAAWMEREIFDLCGVFFTLNKDLRRILTDYGFNGYPLRKDFPLTGYIESFYDDNQKKVSYKPVELSQEYRNFNFKAF